MTEVRGVLVAALVAALALLAVRALVSVDPARRNFAVFTEMARSRAVESFAPSAVLPGGRAQQPLVPGVVPRGFLPLGFGAGSEEAERAGRELASPFTGEDAAAQARGAQRYRIFCAVCHGADGGGGGPAVARGFPPPPSLLGARAMGLEDGALFHVLTFGQGLMAPFAAELDAEDRWRVVLHLRKLQEAGQ